MTINRFIFAAAMLRQLLIFVNLTLSVFLLQLNNILVPVAHAITTVNIVDDIVPSNQTLLPIQTIQFKKSTTSVSNVELHENNTKQSMPMQSMMPISKTKILETPRTFNTTTRISKLLSKTRTQTNEKIGLSTTLMPALTTSSSTISAWQIKSIAPVNVKTTGTTTTTSRSTIISRKNRNLTSFLGCQKFHRQLDKREQPTNSQFFINANPFSFRKNIKQMNESFAEGTNTSTKNSSDFIDKSFDANRNREIFGNFDTVTDTKNPLLVETTTIDQSRLSTINEILFNLFPQGFSDLLSLSYFNDSNETTTTEPTTTTTTTSPVSTVSNVSTKTNELRKRDKSIQQKINTATIRSPVRSIQLDNTNHTTTMNIQTKRKIPTNITNAFFKNNEKDLNNFTGNSKESIRISSSVTREYRREVQPGHTEIIIEKIIKKPLSTTNIDIDNKFTVYTNTNKIDHKFNILNRDELLKINQAANHESVLPSLYVNPTNNNEISRKLDNMNNNNNNNNNQAIVVLTKPEYEDDLDDLIEDDNQLAESHNGVHEVYYKPSESTYYQNSAYHNINIHILHDNKTINNLTEGETTVDKKNLYFTPASELSDHDTVSEAAELDTVTNRTRRVNQQIFGAKILNNNQNKFSTNPYNEKIINSATTAILPPTIYDINNLYTNAKNQTLPIFPLISNMDMRDLSAISNINQQFISNNNYSYVNLSTGIPLYNFDTSNQLDGNTVYQFINSQNDNEQPITPVNLIFVTISPPHSVPIDPNYPTDIPTSLLPYYTAYTTPVDYFASNTNQFILNNNDYRPIMDNQTDNIIDQKSGTYTSVEVLKSVNVHNKMTKEQNGRLLEQHEIFYPQALPQIDSTPKAIKSFTNFENIEVNASLPNPVYESLSMNPIHVKSTNTEEDYEVAASHKNEHHLTFPELENSQIDSVQQSQAIHEIHTIEQVPVVNDEPIDKNKHIQLLPDNPLSTLLENSQFQQPVKQQIIPFIPYLLPERAPIPITVAYYINRPYTVGTVGTILEKPTTYTVDNMIENVIGKHTPLSFEHIEEKPIKYFFQKYNNRPYNVFNKKPISNQQSIIKPTKYTRKPYYFSGPNIPWNLSTFSNSLSPFTVVRTYQNKVMKNLLPFVYNNNGYNFPRQYITKLLPNTIKSVSKNNNNLEYELKPPPQSSLTSTHMFQSQSLLDPQWDKGARYIYNYNKLPQDLTIYKREKGYNNYDSSSSSSISSGIKTNFDEFLRWRNGQQLKRSPEFGRNLHVEYGFKPPLIPSVEIDDHGVPLKLTSVQKQ